MDAATEIAEGLQRDAIAARSCQHAPNAGSRDRPVGLAAQAQQIDPAGRNTHGHGREAGADDTHRRCAPSDGFATADQGRVSCGGVGGHFDDQVLGKRVGGRSHCVLIHGDDGER